MFNCQVIVAGGAPVGRRSSAPARVAAATGAGPRSIAAALMLLAALDAAPILATPSAAETAPAVAQEASYWITVGEDVFARAREKLAPLPGWSDGVMLERYDAHDGVVLTRLPASAIDALSEIVHQDFRRCGGFVKHESLEEAVGEMVRLRSPRAELGVLPFAIDQPVLTGILTAQVDQASVLSTITALSTIFPNRFHDHHAVHHSADWIRDLWSSYAAGRPEVTVELYPHGSITPQPSVILTIPGSTSASEYVILGAHQDSTLGGGSCVGSPNCVAPGADDDASGVGAISEVIRIALASGFQPQRTIQFMAYAAEEVGLDGSTDIAEDYQNAAIDVVAVMQLDMTAYEGSVNDVYLIADRTDSDLNGFVEDLIDTYLSGLTHSTTLCGYGCSDHAPWDSRGFRATFPFESAFEDYNGAIHTTGDTTSVAGFSAAHAAKFARIAAAFLVETGIDGAQPTGSLRLTSTSQSVGESAGNATFTVTRLGGAFGAATVHCRTVAGGTATAGSDYTATDATLNWAAGEIGARTCTIPILNDGLDEPDETVFIALQSATGATVGTPATATLTILDDDVADPMPFLDGFESGNTSRWSMTIP